MILLTKNYEIFIKVDLEKHFQKKYVPSMVFVGKSWGGDLKEMEFNETKPKKHFKQY